MKTDNNRIMEADVRLAKGWLVGAIIYTMLDLSPQIVNILALDEKIAATHSAAGVAQVLETKKGSGRYTYIQTNTESVKLSCALPGFYTYHSCPGDDPFSLEPKNVYATWFESTAGIFERINTPLTIRDSKTGQLYISNTKDEIKKNASKQIQISLLICGSLLYVGIYFSFFNKKKPKTRKQ